MRPSDLSFEAVSLQEKLRQQGDYGHVSVHPRAGHLNIEVEDSEGLRSIVARATSLGAREYGLSFRTSSGKWEPMPVAGSLEDVAKGVVDLLTPFLDRSNLR